MEGILLIIVSSTLLIALWLVLLLVIEGCLKIYRRLHAPHVVTCPANRQPAALQLAVSAPTAFSNTGVPRRRVRRCSRWPEHERCGQACLHQIKPVGGAE